MKYRILQLITLSYHSSAVISGNIENYYTHPKTHQIKHTQILQLSIFTIVIVLFLTVNLFNFLSSYLTMIVYVVAMEIIAPFQSLNWFIKV